MNILEIIAEADTKPKVVKNSKTGKYSVLMPDGRQVGNYSSQKAAMDDLLNRPEKFKKIPTTNPSRKNRNRRKPPAPTPTKSDTSVKPDHWDRTVARWKNRAENYEAYKTRTVPKWIGRLSGVLRTILKGAGLLTPVYTLYEELANLELDFIEGNDPYNSGND